MNPSNIFSLNEENQKRTKRNVFWFKELNFTEQNHIYHGEKPSNSLHLIILLCRNYLFKCFFWGLLCSFGESLFKEFIPVEMCCQSKDKKLGCHMLHLKDDFHWKFSLRFFQDNFIRLKNKENLQFLTWALLVNFVANFYISLTSAIGLWGMMASISVRRYFLAFIIGWWKSKCGSKSQIIFCFGRKKDEQDNYIQLQLANFNVHFLAISY